MSDPVLWLDGELVSAGDAGVSPFDHGLLVGDGVFETLRVYAGNPFAWTRHHRRLVRSAAGLGLTVPGSQELRGAVDAVLAANGLTDGRVRLTVTGGPSPLGSERGDGPPTVIVVAAPAVPWPPTVDVVIVPWSRNENGAVAGLKTTSYAENVRALAYAREHDAGEAVFLNTRGELCEATGSNLFVVWDGVVRTPRADAGCLLGVTRALVLELCAEHGMPAQEPVLGPESIRDADEAFLTSSTREVQPIGRVDGRALPAAPGPTSEKLAGLLTELIARDPDP
ncbi:MAG TPA: aminotransferase class IV [Acidimicrobiia bacterium]|nr:aminotransferase class IV [Acidimicrobiia bacterium]